MNDFFNRSYSVNDTTCAPETFLRGPGQKAISFLYFAMTPNATKVSVDPGHKKYLFSGGHNFPIQDECQIWSAKVLTLPLPRQL